MEAVDRYGCFHTTLAIAQVQVLMPSSKIVLLYIFSLIGRLHWVLTQMIRKPIFLPADVAARSKGSGVVDVEDQPPDALRTFATWFVVQQSRLRGEGHEAARGW